MSFSELYQARYQEYERAPMQRLARSLTQLQGEQFAEGENARILMEVLDGNQRVATHLLPYPHGR
jgi:hypothetical protein